MKDDYKDNELKKEIGDRFREFRLKILEQSQDELAHNMKYTRAGISLIESGIQNAPLYLLVKLNTKYKLSLNWLLTGKGEVTVGGGKKTTIDEYFSGLTTQDKVLANSIKTCRDFFTSASENEKDAVLKLIKSLSASYQK